MISDWNQLNNEIDMLKGNVNRICITSDLEEAEKMYFAVIHRMNEIYEYNVKRIKIEVK